MRDNDSTSPDIMQARVRSGRSQTDLNLALALSNKQSATAGGTGASVNASIAANVGAAIGGSGDTVGGGGGGGLRPRCFAGDTLVIMADWSEKPIRDIKLYLDVVKVPLIGGGFADSQVIHRTETIYSEWIKVHFEDGRVVEVRKDHRYRAVGNDYVPIVALDRVCHLNEDREWEICMIKEIEIMDKNGELDFYNLGVRHEAKAYIAAGDWVSNLKPLSTD